VSLPPSARRDLRTWGASVGLPASVRSALKAAGIPPDGVDAALCDVLLERCTQAVEWGGVEHDDLHVPSEWLAFLLKQIAKAAEDPEPGSGEFRGRLVRIAALALAAIESQDRLTEAGQ